LITDLSGIRIIRCNLVRVDEMGREHFDDLLLVS